MYRAVCKSLKFGYPLETLTPTLCIPLPSYRDAPTGHMCANRNSYQDKRPTSCTAVYCGHHHASGPLYATSLSARGVCGSRQWFDHDKQGTRPSEDTPGSFLWETQCICICTITNPFEASGIRQSLPLPFATSSHELQGVADLVGAPPTTSSITAPWTESWWRVLVESLGGRLVLHDGAECVAVRRPGGTPWT